MTHTLRIETEEAELSAPVLVREIDADGGRDAISPYGYPGAETGGRLPIDPERAGLSESGLVTAFLRHALGPPPLSGSSERNVVQIADPELPEKSRMSDRQQIRRNERRGYAVRLVPGPSTTAEDRAGFVAAYEQTMRRAEAAERYFFGAPYFDRILEAEGSWLALASVEGEVAAASILVRSDDYLHYYLSGTVDERLRDSPMKNVVAALVETSGETGLPLNLGGGIVQGGPAGGVQARLRQSRDRLAHLRARLRPRRVRAPLRGPGGAGVLPRLPGAGLIAGECRPLAASIPWVRAASARGS